MIIQFTNIIRQIITLLELFKIFFFKTLLVGNKNKKLNLYFNTV